MRAVYVINACQSCVQPRYRLRSNQVCVLLVSYRPLARLNARESWKPRPGGTPSNPLVGALLASVYMPLASQAFCQNCLQVTAPARLDQRRELDGIGSPEPRTPFSPKRMNLRGAVRVPLPPSEIDRVGAEVAAMRGGLSRRDVGVALVVAGLGALTLAFA